MGWRHRTVHSVLLLAFVLLMIDVPARADGGLNPPTPTRRALLIAVQETDTMMSEYFPPLRYPTRDAVQLYRVLRDPALGNFTDVRVVASRRQLETLRGEYEKKLAQGGLSPAEAREARGMVAAVKEILNNPKTPPSTLQLQERSQTARAIERAIADFAAALTEEDEGFLYFSSHGFRAHGIDRLLLEVGDVVMVASDTWIDKTPGRLPWDNGIKMSKVLATLATSPCRRLVILQAACAARVDFSPPGRRNKTVTDPDAEIKILDRDRYHITLIGAAREFAQELDSVQGDLFSYYFRMAMERRLHELGGEWTGWDQRIDTDHDGALSVQEAYDVAEVAVRRETARLVEQEIAKRAAEQARREAEARKQGRTLAPEEPPPLEVHVQEPYLLTGGSGKIPFIVSGHTTSTPVTTVFYPWPPIRSGVIANRKGVSLRVDDQPVDSPAALDPGTHRLELLDSAGRTIDRRSIRTGAGEHVHPEEVFLEPRRRLEVTLGPSAWLGPPATPDTAPGTPLLPGLSARISAKRLLLSAQDLSWSLEAGARLQLGGGLPSQGGNFYTSSYQLAAGGELGVNRRLFGRFRTDLLLGAHVQEYFLNNYDFRTTLLVPGWGPHAALSWRIRPHVWLGLVWEWTFVYADLDCNEDIANWDPYGLSAEVTQLKALLPTRCGATDTGAFVPDPAVYAQSLLGAAWEWRF